MAGFRGMGSPIACRTPDREWAWLGQKGPQSLKKIQPQKPELVDSPRWLIKSARARRADNTDGLPR